MPISNTAEARIVGKYKDDVSGPAQKSFEKLKSFAKTAAVAVAAVGAASAAAVVQFVKAANEQEAAEKKLETALKARGRFSEQLFSDLKQAASELQAVTTTGDEAIQEVQAQLIAFSDGTEDINRVTEAVLDLSSGMGSDLKSSALLLGKAMAGEFGTLSRYGIFVDENATKSEKLDQALQQINNRFGGQARAAAETFAGSFQQLKNVFGDLQEEFGLLIVKNKDFLDLIQAGKETLLGWIQGLQANKQEAKEVVTVLGGVLISSLRVLVETIKFTLLFLKDMADAWNAVSRGTAEFIARLGEGVAALKQFGSDAVQKFVDGFQERWEALKDKIGNLIPDWLKKFLKQSSPAELGDLDTFAWGAQSVTLFADGMDSLAPRLTTASERVGQSMSRTIGGAILSLKEGFSGLEQFALRTLENITNSQLQNLANLAGQGISAGASALISSLFPGFAHGGSFTVPGSGGTDSRLVGFRATPGEKVTVETPGQRGRGGRNITVNQTIVVQAGVSPTVRAEMLSLLPAFKQETIAGVVDAQNRNQLGGAFG